MFAGRRNRLRRGRWGKRAAACGLALTAKKIRLFLIRLVYYYNNTCNDRN